MSALLDALAEHTANLGHGAWDADGVYTAGQNGIVVGHLPAEPDDLVGLTTYPGPESDTRLPWDTSNVQFRVRAARDGGAMARVLAQGIYDDLHGTGVTTLPGEVVVANIVGQQGGPVDIGPDQENRAEFTVNVSVEWRNTTTHRP